MVIWFEKLLRNMSYCILVELQQLSDLVEKSNSGSYRTNSTYSFGHHCYNNNSAAIQAKRIC